MDPETLRAVAVLARRLSERGSCGSSSDGLMRLGAARALKQLAVDLDVTATEFERRPPKPKSKHNRQPFRA